MQQPKHAINARAEVARSDYCHDDDNASAQLLFHGTMKKRCDPPPQNHNGCATWTLLQQLTSQQAVQSPIFGTAQLPSDSIWLPTRDTDISCTHRTLSLLNVVSFHIVAQ